MTTTSSSSFRVSNWALWFGLFGGVIAWILHLFTGYSIAYVGCLFGLPDFRIWLILVTAVLAVVAAAAILVAYRNGQHIDQYADAEGAAGDNQALGRIRLMAVLGAWLGGLSLMMILMAGIAIVWITPCG